MGLTGGESEGFPFRNPFNGNRHFRFRMVIESAAMGAVIQYLRQSIASGIKNEKIEP